jgi:hypothetical protein
MIGSGRPRSSQVAASPSKGFMASRFPVATMPHGLRTQPFGARPECVAAATKDRGARSQPIAVPSNPFPVATQPRVAQESP